MNDIPFADYLRGFDYRARRDEDLATGTADALYRGSGELLDIRVPEETAVWQINLGLRILATELPTRLDKLPQDKLLAVACPMTDRSNMARSYLVTQGFEDKYLQDDCSGWLIGSRAARRQISGSQAESASMSIQTDQPFSRLRQVFLDRHAVDPFQ
ncbi:MAG: rhodanese-like domain-containing protein [Thermochromatium sp.]